MSHGNNTIKLPSLFFIDCSSDKMGRHIFFVNQKERRVEQKSPEIYLLEITKNDVNEMIFSNYKFNKWTGLLSKQPSSKIGQYKKPFQLFDKCKILKENFNPIFK